MQIPTLKQFAIEALTLVAALAAALVVVFDLWAFLGIYR